MTVYDGMGGGRGRGRLGTQGVVGEGMGDWGRYGRERRVWEVEMGTGQRKALEVW